jgi:hypothetical protein
MDSMRRITAAAKLFRPAKREPLTLRRREVGALSVICGTFLARHNLLVRRNPIS